MLSHQAASFTSSCVVAPRNPKTKLPTTVVERNYLENQKSDRSYKDNYVPSASVTVDGQIKSKLKDNSRSKVNSHKRLNPNRPRTPPTVKHTKTTNIRSHAQRPSTAPVVQSSSVTENPFDLNELINDDDQFFTHLQYLKNENKRTLKKLEGMYNTSLLQRKNHLDAKAFSTREISDKFRQYQRPGTDFCTQSEKERHDVWSKAAESSTESLDFTSEDELDEKLKVIAPEEHVNILPEEVKGEEHFRGRSSSYDVIASMWEDFSVNQYVPYTRQKKEKKSWSPQITIPEPFQMTIRDEAKHKYKSKHIEKIELEKLQRQLEEEEELQKRAVPTPVPPSTYLPLYEELKEQQEKKREYVRDINKEILKLSEKPFSFIKREEAKKELKRSKSLNNLYKTQQQQKRKNLFKANPFPERLFDLTLADKLAEEEEYRKIKVKLRSEEMLASSSLPLSMKTRGSMRYYPTGEKTCRVKEELRQRKSKSFRPQIHYDIPDFEKSHIKYEQELERRKHIKTPTICEPFDLHTAKIPTRRERFRQSVEQNRGGKRPPSGIKHNRSKSLEQRANLIQNNDTSWKGSSPAVSLNETTRLRQERLRKSLEKSKEESLRQTIEDFKKTKQQNKLKKKVAKKASVNDVSRNRSKEMQEKLESFRQADFNRLKEYKNYIRSMEDQLGERPLLFERESQTNAKRKAQRRYEEILKEAGVERDVLDSILQASADRSVLRTSVNSYTRNDINDDKTGSDDSSCVQNVSESEDEDSWNSNKKTSLDNSGSENESSLGDNGPDDSNANHLSDDGSYTPIANNPESSEEVSDDD